MTHKCIVEDCKNSAERGMLCFKHYMRRRRNGTTDETRRSRSEGVFHESGCAVFLSKGYIAFVDPDDFERVIQYPWMANENANQVRAMRMVGRSCIYLHHFVLNTSPEELNGNEVDHKDRDPLNNRKNNLRIVTHKENMENSLNAGKGIGVTFNKRANSWMAYLDTPDGRKYLGYRKTKEAALVLVECARNANN